jgi:uncharacterized protein
MGFLFSPTDIVNFLGCRFATLQDILVLRGEKKRPPPAEDRKLLQDAGIEHEKAFLEHLRTSGKSVLEIASGGSLQTRVDKTLGAMREGVEVIYQAALLSPPWHGFADFLLRTTASSKLGSHGYQAVDTKLKRSATAKFFLQLGLYSLLLESIQGFLPKEMKLVLGDNSEETFPTEDVVFYLRHACRGFEDFVRSPDFSIKPEPCKHCSICAWNDECQETWKKEDHLYQVANIKRSQIEKLRAAGIDTVERLAEAPEQAGIPWLGTETFQKLKQQAALQFRKRTTGTCEVIPLPLRDGLGFYRLPPPDPGDLFFDMEGDPLFPGGLEYLFGVFYRWEKPHFKAFWGHDRPQEKRAFEDVIDFFLAHSAEHPGAHIFHYNHYEVTALKRLMGQHRSREEEIDSLLRRGIFVDLYKVVREGIMVSESGYSLKDLEIFYMPRREGEVKNASQSIVVYEAWRHAKDPSLLKEIEAYNRIDCESTASCLDWLLTLRPRDIPWFQSPSLEDGLSEQAIEARQERAEFQEALSREFRGSTEAVRELILSLTDFHRREQKPQWWKIFDLAKAAAAELLEDLECISGLTRNGPPTPEKNSLIFPYRFPPQETKRRVSEKPLQSDSLLTPGTIVAIDPVSGFLEIKRGKKLGEPPEALSLLPPQPVPDKTLREAIKRVARSCIDADGRFSALKAFLNHQPPFAESAENPLPLSTIDPEHITEVVLRLASRVLFIQGPPGCGKTFNSAQVILNLLKQGKRIGVSSNSHKAIINLLRAVEKAASQEGRTFQGAKKSDKDDPEKQFGGRFIRDIFKREEITSADALVAGTAWLFSDPGFEEAFDYLFVDEAGQVSLANLTAMGTAARNIILVGDQMQLGQPIQGIHPGESGASALEFLLQGRATVPPETGIFLGTTWRLHPSICGFISDAVYDGRLRSHPDNDKQILALGTGAHPALKSQGIVFLPADHSGCSQKSEVEARIVADLYRNLLEQHYIDRKGDRHPVRNSNILIIAPYNLQTNYLKSILPEDARVGTVDKFQGQEAEVVLISMTTSDVDELPRDIEFLFSKNRLNVAVSRARSLAIVVASPKLLEIPCETVEQLALVNTLCRLKEWSERSSQCPGRAYVFG